MNLRAPRLLGAGAGRRVLRGVGLALLLAAPAGLAPSCTKTSDVSFVLRLPGEAKDGTQWIEVGAYKSETCPSIGQLGGGLPRGGLLRRVGFESGGAAPTFTLDKGTYSFAATARNSQCEVLAAGCTAIDVPGSDEITINLKAATVKGGKCSSGSACKDAECVAAPTAATVGEGCTLEVVGAGPLEALSTGGSSVSRPAISAVSDGFVIGYSQIDGDKYRVTTMKVGFDGGPVKANEGTSLPYNRYNIPGACSEDSQTEGLGLFFDAPNAQTGLAVVPRAPTCVAALVSIFQILPDAHFAATEAKTPPLRTAAQQHVVTNHSLAYNGYFANVVDKQAYLQVLSAAGFGADAPVPVGGAPPHARAWAAASRDAIAVLVQVEGEGAAPSGDGGSGSSDIDAPELRLEVARRDNAQTLGMVEPALRGRFGALAMQGARAVVLSSGGLDAPVQYNLLNVGDSAFKTGSVPVNETGRTLAADVALAGDRMYIASMLTNGVSVLAFDKFSGEPKLLKEKALARDFRVKQFMGGIFNELRDGYIAVAAEGARVGVVWMTGERINAGEEVGGWAVLACR